tara:strand:+ start:507 stop:1670 length:1164 start_codon:yes stop_codon:yes gene_type:complete
MKLNYIKYCKSCITPATKPDFKINADGICAGCQSFTYRKHIDWKRKEKDFLEIINKYKNNNHSNYDCIIPCSGGKDSTYQTIKVLEYGLNPLCVTASTDMLSEIGRKNIENIKKLGVDHMEVSTDPNLRRKINLFTLETIGDISWAEHITIFTIPVRIAVNMRIPLIIWGENASNEHGGPANDLENNIFDRRRLEELGGIGSLRTSDLPDLMGIEEKKLIQYTYPSKKELIDVGVIGIFLGYYFPWDGKKNAEIAAQNGFMTYHKNVEGSVVNYENLDNLQMRIHDYFKFLKYGFDRVTDWCSIHIRRGRMKREEAVEIAREWGGKYPDEYLGVKLEEVLREIGCDKARFDKICNNFTNKKLFKLDPSGKPIRDNHNNLIKINYENV